MANVRIVFQDKKDEALVINDVDMQVNQVGFLVFTDARTRMPVYLVNPMGVKYIHQTSNVESIIDVVA